MKAKFFLLLILSFILSFPSAINASTRKKTTTTVQKSYPSLVGKIYVGKVYCQPYAGMLDYYVAVYFKSTKEFYLLGSVNVVGPYELQELTELALQGENTDAIKMSYTYKNGVVRMTGTDRLRVENNGKTLYYYVNGHEKEVHGTLYLSK